MNGKRLKESFAQVAAHGDAVALFFYSDLFLRNPNVREMFPVSMTQQRDRLLSALGHIVSQVEDLDALVPFLQQLGRDHRKFGTLSDHYGAVGASLLATLAYYLGPAWTPELAADWKAAFALVAQVMIDAAKADEVENPPWWNGTVVAHERRAFDVAVLRVAPARPLPYRPGQSVAVECAARPRLWRQYSMANAPRRDGTLDFHVRMIDGGPVSMALVHQIGVGARVRMGAAVGGMDLDTRSGRSVLMIAGSTGLAPMKALLEQLAGGPQAPPSTHVFFGARTIEGLYDGAALEKFAAEHPWCRVTCCVSGEPDYPGERGNLPDVVSRYGPWTSRDAYVCGSPEMITATVDSLVRLGVPREQIKTDDFGGS